MRIKLALALALLLALATVARGQLSMMGIGNQGVAVACVPGASNGQMDFSVCSNVGITAALW